MIWGAHPYFWKHPHRQFFLGWGFGCHFYRNLPPEDIRMSRKGWGRIRLPKTNITPEKWWLEAFLFGLYSFRWAQVLWLLVSGRVGFLGISLWCFNEGCCWNPFSYRTTTSWNFGRILHSWTFQSHDIWNTRRLGLKRTSQGWNDYGIFAIWCTLTHEHTSKILVFSNWSPYLNIA